MQQFCILLLVALCPQPLASVSPRCFKFKNVVWLLNMSMELCFFCCSCISISIIRAMTNEKLIATGMQRRQIA